MQNKKNTSSNYKDTNQQLQKHTSQKQTQRNHISTQNDHSKRKKKRHKTKPSDTKWLQRVKNSWAAKQLHNKQQPGDTKILQRDVSRLHRFIFYHTQTASRKINWPENQHKWLRHKKKTSRTQYDETQEAKQPQTQNVQKKVAKLPQRQKHSENKNTWNICSCSQMWRLCSDYIIKRTWTPKQTQSDSLTVTQVHKLEVNISLCSSERNTSGRPGTDFTTDRGENTEIIWTRNQYRLPTPVSLKSRDKVAFCPIKYLHSGVLPITCPNTCGIKSDPCTVVIIIHLICFKAQRQSVFTEEHTYSHIQAI